ncbi:MAG: DegT/DnrJ/EryC1/StrS family aminotransferase, partial [Spirochaetota bacterium]
MKMGIVESKPTITRKELEGVLDCMIQDELTTGTTVKKLEAHCGQLTGMKFCLATSSHTAAYHLAFKALDISPGDEVIIPSFFNSAPLSASQLCGAKPVLVDIDEGSFSPSAEQIRELISERTRAVVVGHLFGFPLDMEHFLQLNIPLI